MGQVNVCQQRDGVESVKTPPQDSTQLNAGEGKGEAKGEDKASGAFEVPERPDSQQTDYQQRVRAIQGREEQERRQARDNRKQDKERSAQEEREAKLANAHSYYRPTRGQTEWEYTDEAETSAPAHARTDLQRFYNGRPINERSWFSWFDGNVDSFWPVHRGLEAEPAKPAHPPVPKEKEHETSEYESVAAIPLPETEPKPANVSYKKQAPKTPDTHSFHERSKPPLPKPREEKPIRGPAKQTRKDPEGEEIKRSAPPAFKPKPRTEKEVTKPKTPKLHFEDRRGSSRPEAPKALVNKDKQRAYPAHAVATKVKVPAVSKPLGIWDSLRIEMKRPRVETKYGKSQNDSIFQVIGEEVGYLTASDKHMKPYKEAPKQARFQQASSHKDDGLRATDSYYKQWKKFFTGSNRHAGVEYGGKKKKVSTNFGIMDELNTANWIDRRTNTAYQKKEHEKQKEEKAAAFKKAHEKGIYECLFKEKWLSPQSAPEKKISSGVGVADEIAHVFGTGSALEAERERMSKPTAPQGTHDLIDEIMTFHPSSDRHLQPHVGKQKKDTSSISTLEQIRMYTRQTHAHYDYYDENNQRGKTQQIKGNAKEPGFFEQLNYKVPGHHPEHEGTVLSAMFAGHNGSKAIQDPNREPNESVLGAIAQDVGSLWSEAGPRYLDARTGGYTKREIKAREQRDDKFYDEDTGTYNARSSTVDSFHEKETKLTSDTSDRAKRMRQSYAK